MQQQQQHSSVKPVPLSCLLKRKEPTAGERGDSTAESGKSPDSFRPIILQIGALDDRKGSAYVEFGATKVVCTVDGPKEPTKSTDLEPAEGQVRVLFKDTAEPSITAGSSASSGSIWSTNKESAGIRNALESALRSVICLDLFCKAQIDVEITVLDDDGGVLAAAMVATSLALIDSGIQVYDICVAAHIIGLPDGHIIVDPSSSSTVASAPRSQEFPGNTHISVTVGIMPMLNQLTCCEFAGIASPDQLRHAIRVAIDSAFKLYPLMRKALSGR